MITLFIIKLIYELVFGVDENWTQESLFYQKKLYQLS